MKYGLYLVENEYLYNKRTSQAKANGFVWASDFPDTEISFSRAKRFYHGNSKLLLNLFYNDITNKKEMAITTMSVEKSYPQNKEKILEVL